MLLDRTLAALAVTVCLSAAADAQCQLQWSAGTEWFRSATLPDGALIVVGDFTSIGGVPANRIARLSGSTWSPLGTGLDGPAWQVVSLANGDVLVAGSFITAGGVTSPGLARWDGATWHAHPGAPIAPVLRMVVMPNGDVIVARGFAPSPTVGYIEIERFDGVAWQVIGTSYGSSTTMPFGTLKDLEVLSDGTLVAVGTWSGMLPFGSGPTTYRELVAWNGTSWDYFFAVPDPEELLQTRNGDLYLASTSLGVGLYHRSAGSWAVAAPGLREVLTLAELPNGDVVAGGYQYGQPGQMGLRRWDGTSWTDLGFWAGGAQGAVQHLAVHAGSGRMFTFGQFASAGGVPAQNTAVLTAPCRPAALSTPTTCVGPAGPLATAVTRLPWTGGELATSTSGFAASSVALVVLGAATASLPLPPVLPTSSAGCDLLVAPDVLALAFPTTGSVEYTLDVPRAATLTGVVLYHQTSQLELTASGIHSASVANRIALTIGTF
jgi:hypothetical protein